MSEQLAIDGGNAHPHAGRFPAPLRLRRRRRGRRDGGAAQGQRDRLHRARARAGHVRARVRRPPRRQVRHLRELRHVRLPHDLRRDQPGPWRRGDLHSVDLRRQRRRSALPGLRPRLRRRRRQLQHRPGRRRGEDHAAHQGDSRRAHVRQPHATWTPTSTCARRHGPLPGRGLQPGPLLRVPGQDRGDDGRRRRLQLQRQAHLRRRRRRRPDQQPLALGPGAPVRRPGPQPPRRPLRRAALRAPVPAAELQDERSDRRRDARPASQDRRIPGEQDTQRQEHHRRPGRRRGAYAPAGAARRPAHLLGRWA